MAAPAPSSSAKGTLRRCASPAARAPSDPQPRRQFPRLAAAAPPAVASLPSLQASQPSASAPQLQPQTPPPPRPDLQADLEDLQLDHSNMTKISKYPSTQLLHQNTEFLHLYATVERFLNGLQAGYSRPHDTHFTSLPASYRFHPRHKLNYKDHRVVDPDHDHLRAQIMAWFHVHPWHADMGVNRTATLIKDSFHCHSQACLPTSIRLLALAAPARPLSPLALWRQRRRHCVCLPPAGASYPSISTLSCPAPPTA